MWSEMSAAMGSIFFLWSIFDRYDVESFIGRQFHKVWYYFYPHLEVTFPEELTGEWHSKNEAYTAIDAYLSDMSTANASCLRGQVPKPGRPMSLSMNDHQQVSDEFQGAELLWCKVKVTGPEKTVISLNHPVSSDKRHYLLTFRSRHRDLVLGAYLTRVLAEGRAVLARRRERKLYTNKELDEFEGLWSGVAFEHPASFDTLAMDPAKKKEIVDDLLTFTEGREYYAKIGKPWKRGYLLYGPPGTGKSTMIAAIANFLNYDIYDLELTAVKSNTDLRNLLIDTSSKSIIVIEDIDCSLDLTGQRKEKTRSENGVLTKVKKALGKRERDGDEDEDEEEDEKKRSKVTLSGLLNFIDGIWSATGGEKMIIFTTNHKDKLDEALIRSGTMDKHIELSYCDFESFKILAKNYLSLDSHPLFDSIETLIGEARITPADVAENLMPKTREIKAGDKEVCLENLIHGLKKKNKAKELTIMHTQQVENSKVEKEEPKPKEKEGIKEERFKKATERRFWTRAYNAG